MAECIPVFTPKRPKDHALLDGTYLYGQEPWLLIWLITPHPLGSVSRFLFSIDWCIFFLPHSTCTLNILVTNWWKTSANKRLMMNQQKSRYFYLEVFFKKFHQGKIKALAIRHLHIFNDKPVVIHQLFVPFLLGRLWHPGELKNKGYTKLWGQTMCIRLCMGRCANGE